MNERDENQYIIYKNQKIYVQNKILVLGGIDDLNEVKGFQDLYDLEELHIRNEDTKEINNLDSLKTLKKLTINCDYISNIEGIEDLTQLEYLGIFYSEIKEIKNLNTLQNLREISLIGNNIEKINNLEGLKKLEIFELKDSKLTEISNLDSLINLKSLMLEQNQIKEISGLNSLFNLELLNLEENRIREIKGLEQLKNLEMLNLGYNEISEIKGLEQLKNLELLYLNNNKITSIQELNGLSSLELLDLRNNLLPDPCQNRRYDFEKEELCDLLDQYQNEKGRKEKKKVSMIILSENPELSTIPLLKSLYKIPILTPEKHPKTTENLKSGRYTYNLRYDIYTPKRTLESISKITSVIKYYKETDNTITYDVERLLDSNFDPFFRFICQCINCQKIWYDHELKYNMEPYRKYACRMGFTENEDMVTGYCPNCDAIIIKYDVEYKDS